MRCPNCSTEDTKVKNTKKINENKHVRRNRFCDICGYKFTTLEKTQLKQVYVIKKSGARKVFDQDKIYQSISKAFRKTKMQREKIDNMIDEIKRDIENSCLKEIKSSVIGDMILLRLRAIDEVAYIRFASVYKEFNSSEDFLDIVKLIKKNAL